MLAFTLWLDRIGTGQVPSQNAPVGQFEKQLAKNSNAKKKAKGRFRPAMHTLSGDSSFDWFLRTTYLTYFRYLRYVRTLLSNLMRESLKIATLGLTGKLRVTGGLSAVPYLRYLM